jgi:undecaprenyl-diphosphatase
MIDYLIQFDTQLFHLINSGLSNPFFNSVMPFVTDLKNWYITYIILFGYLFIKGGKNGRIAATTLIFAIILTDQISSMFIKELVGRLRPCITLENINLLVSCGAGKSFPSSHAANSFATATILSYFYPQYKHYLYSIATVICFSRVYVGVHYPSDVIGGAFIGFLIASIILFFLKLYYLPVKKF